jgi:hypothetical protein
MGIREHCHPLAFELDATDCAPGYCAFFSGTQIESNQRLMNTCA